MKSYLVGGAVRDKLLGIPLQDKDYVVVGSDEQHMLDAGFVRVGKDFPVFLHPDTKDEYALARTERKAGHGYGGFSVDTGVHVRLEDDLMRRDLTINAIALDEDGTRIDPYNGLADLNARVLRHVSPAFVEDPLRVLRVARFAAQLAEFDFKVAEDTIVLMRSMVRSGELNYLAPDRVWLELTKALKTPKPSEFIRVLRACGALAVILPELDNLFGVPATITHHPEIDSGVHTLMALDAVVKVSTKPEIRFAVLVHDLGKALTPKNNWPRQHGHDVLGVDGIKQVQSRLPIPKSYYELAIRVAKYHIRIHQTKDLSPKAILKICQGIDLFRQPDRLDDILIACTADVRGRLGFEDREYDPVPYWQKIRAALLALDTRSIIGDETNGDVIKDKIQKARINALKALSE